MITQDTKLTKTRETMSVGKKLACTRGYQSTLCSAHAPNLALTLQAAEALARGLFNARIRNRLIGNFGPILFVQY